MGRRRKNELADVLITLPWQVSAVCALAAFIGLRWVLPGFLLQSPLLAGLRPISGLLAWVALCAFGFLALLAALSPTRAPTRPAARPVARRAEKNLNSPPSRQPEKGAGDSVLHAATQHCAPDHWTLAALRSLEWKRFELLCARYYQAVGFKTETLEAGPDGGIDVKLFKADPATPLAIVQCKAWNTNQVGVKEIRELLGVMAHVKVARGIFVTTGSYTKDALEFGAANPIQLLDGPALEKKIRDLSKDDQDALLRFAFDGDYRTPTCASCGIKMLARDSNRGPFWGCRHYPRCKTTLPMRSKAD
jgi:restriction system protein